MCAKLYIGTSKSIFFGTLCSIVLSIFVYHILARRLIHVIVYRLGTKNYSQRKSSLWVSQPVSGVLLIHSISNCCRLSLICLLHSSDSVNTCLYVYYLVMSYSLSRSDRSRLVFKCLNSHYEYYNLKGN